MPEVIIQNGEGSLMVGLERPYSAGEYLKGKVKLGITIPLKDPGKDPRPTIDRVLKVLSTKADEVVEAEVAAVRGSK